MIITLMGADFSESNIGTLSSWIISRVLGDGATYNGPSYVDKDAALSATVTLDEGYEIGSAGITVTMGGTALDESYYSVVDNVITFTIASVTGSVVIKVPTLNTNTGEEDVIPNYIFTINPTPTSATVTLTATGYSTVSGTGSKSITVANGTKVNWSVSADGYTTRTGNWTINGSNKTENIVLTTTGGEGATTWYLDHTNQASDFTSSVNIAGRGWTHKPGTAGYNAYVGKPVNTIGFFTNLASQDVTLAVGPENGTMEDSNVIATVTATSSGNGKELAIINFPTVTLNSGECLMIFASANDQINFYYNGNASVIDANGIVDGNFYGRVPQVFGSGIAWTAYTEKICLGISVGYTTSE